MDYPAIAPASSLPTLDSSLPAYNADVLIAVPADQVEEGQLKEKGRNWLYRHAGNSIFGRALEASVATSKASISSVSCISPWGDNNPVVLPCIRVRDVALMGLMTATGGLSGIAHVALGDPSAYFFASTLAGHIIAGEINDHATKWVLFRSVDKSLGLDQEMRKILTTDEVLTLEITLKHQLLNNQAQLGFYKPPSSSSPDAPPTLAHMPSSLKDAFDSLSLQAKAVRAYLDWSKGWFSPCLMASHRTPAIPRMERPVAIMSYGPFIEADYLFAQHLLASTSQIIPFCEPDPSVDVPFERLFVGFIGLSPFRSAWTHSRRPGEAKLLVHLANGVPSLVLPILPGTPLQTWDALPLLSLFHLSPEDFETHVKAVTLLLSSFIDWSHVSLPAASDATGDEKQKSEAVARAVELLYEGVRMLKGLKVMKEKVDGERAGVVCLRFGDRSLFEGKDEGVMGKVGGWFGGGGKKGEKRGEGEGK